MPSKSDYNMITLVGPKELLPIKFLVDLDITAQCAHICGIQTYRNSEYNFSRKKVYSVLSVEIPALFLHFSHTNGKIERTKEDSSQGQRTDRENRGLESIN